MRFKEEIEKIKRLVVEATDSEFHVGMKSDDGGPHFVIYLPHDTETDKIFETIPLFAFSKRYVIMMVPEETLRDIRSEDANHKKEAI